MIHSKGLRGRVVQLKLIKKARVHLVQECEGFHSEQHSLLFMTVLWGKIDFLEREKCNVVAWLPTILEFHLHFLPRGDSLLLTEFYAECMELFGLILVVIIIVSSSSTRKFFNPLDSSTMTRHSTDWKLSQRIKCSSNGAAVLRRQRVGLMSWKLTINQLSRSFFFFYSGVESGRLRVESCSSSSSNIINFLY